MRVLFALAIAACSRDPEHRAAPPQPSSSAAANDVVGDVTCETDADCAVTTKRDCCACCPRRALATNKKWLQKRDTTECPTYRCIACEESCKPEEGRQAACTAGKCTLVR